MAIITCTECNHRVSDKADFCPNCGYSVNNILNDLRDKIICKINGRDVDVTNLKKEMKSLTQEDFEHYKYAYTHKIDKKMIQMFKEDKRFDDNYSKAISLYNRYYQEYDLTPNTMKQFLCMFIDNDLEPFDFDGDSFQAWQNKQKEKDVYRPRCPMCGSTNIQKISDFSRASSILGFGILSKKIGKQWQCNNPKCKHLW